MFAKVGYASRSREAGVDAGEIEQGERAVVADGSPH
jgi:hypothetical protein